MMDYPCANFGNFSFSCFGYYHADRQNHRHGRSLIHYTHATTVGMSKQEEHQRLHSKIYFPTNTEGTAKVVNDVFCHLENFHRSEVNISGVVNQQTAVLHLQSPLLAIPHQQQQYIIIISCHPLIQRVDMMQYRFQCYYREQKRKLERKLIIFVNENQNENQELFQERKLNQNEN